MKKLLLAICLLLSLLATAPAAWPAYERRNEALQLYQEGLFQETGTGDLASAEKIYTTLREHFEDYRDIASVAWYHLGLIYEKHGNIQEARRCFNTVTIRYPDQAILMKQAQFKLDQTRVLSPPTVPATPVPVAPMSAQQPAADVVSASPRPVPTQTGPKAFVWEAGLNNHGLMAGGQITDRIVLETNIRFNPDFAGFDLRSRLPLEAWLLQPALIPYLGLEGGLDFVSGSSSGYHTGFFIGFEFFFWSNLSLQADAGNYYFNSPGTSP